MQRSSAALVLALVILLSGISLISAAQAGGGRKKGPFPPEPERGDQAL
jgi:hypothetical protein